MSEKPKRTKTTVVEPAQVPARLESEDLPAWFFTGEGEVEPYDGLEGSESASESSLPFVGIANEKTGSSGGKVAFGDLQQAGIAAGDAYAFGGPLDGPRRLAGVPLLLLRGERVAYTEGAGFRRESPRRIQTKEDATPDECQAIDTLLLVLDPAGAFLATYTERLRAGVGLRSTIVMPWRDKIAKAPVDRLPAWVRVAGRIRTDPPKMAKKPAKDGKTYSYRREYLVTAPLDVAEVGRLGAWLRSDAAQVAKEAATAWAALLRGGAPPMASADSEPF